MGGGEESSSFKYVITMASLLLCCINSTAQTNTLNQSDTLNSTQHLVSTNNTFTLGFFKPSNTSTNTYLAIWYSQSSIPVWIANRDTPITSGSASLIFDSTGMLLIDRTHAHPIHLCPPETTTAAANTTAILLDNGNLVVTEVNSDGSAGRTLWQSFNCPSDTLLPQMKLGINHRTGKNWTLTSWLTQDDPSPGPFTLEWDPSGVQLVIRRRGVVFWTSGTLKNDIFENMLLFNDLLQYYHMAATTSSDEESFSYSLKDGRDDPTSVRWRIGFRGKLEFEDIGIQLENICYGYNTDRGCAIWEQPECRSDQTTFELISGSFVKADGDVDDGHFDASVGPNDCRISCWNDCNCQAYKNSDEMGCTTHSRNVKFRRDSSWASPAFYVIQRPQDGTKKIKKWIWIAISVLITLLFVSCIVVIFYLRWKRKGKESTSENHLLQLMTPPDTSHNTNELEYDYNFAQYVKVFDFASIVEATNNFYEENKLGEGGFGPVYKGKLPRGEEIAVKRLSTSSGQGQVEFKNELIVIAKLQHMNLVRLLGCSIQVEEKMLVYEYMPNRSLDCLLFDPSKSSVLDWKKRAMIIEGISQGLLYFHQHSRLRIIHRDLKASNILLDADMNPKISDFGMARIFRQNDRIANTKRIVGTYGYMSPEYAMEGIFSVKSDVFSFGVLILEILSGKRNNSLYGLNGALNLIGYAWELWQRDAGLDLMDPILSDSCSREQFLRLFQVGLLCVEDSPADRPCISQVISMTTNQSIHLPLVNKPAFMNLDKITSANFPREDSEYHSVNGVSISIVDAR